MSIPSVSNARVFDSAMSYELPAYTGGYHVSPRHASKFFKGLLITSDGNLKITGCDGIEVTFAVTAGLYPFAGMKLGVAATTPATVAVILY
jgi:hypothetical protein